MDKQSILGIVIIGVLLIGFMYITRPSQEQKEEQKRIQDSVTQANLEKEKQDSIAQLLAEQAQIDKEKEAQINQDFDSIPESFISEDDKRILAERERQIQYGVFAHTAEGENKFITVENELMIIKFSTKGGKVHSVELKEFKKFGGEPLIMYDSDSISEFGLEMIADGKSLLTNNLFFKPEINEDYIKISSGEKSIRMRLEVNPAKYIEYVYTISADDYMFDFDINIVGLNQELAFNPYITLRWTTLIPAMERPGSDWESDNTSINVRMERGDLEKLSGTKDEDDFTSSARVQWIAFKQQFFSSVLIGKNDIDNPSVKLNKIEGQNNKYLKKFDAELSFPFNRTDNQQISFNFYFGPNKYSLLKSYDIGMEKLVPLGWGIFGWVNRFVVIPIFNWLGGFISSYGLIILLLTLIIKIALFPLTYKSYLSSAKMRILKPQVDELGKKYPKGKEMEKQQAVMALYKKAGASPLGGCLPMLLQFPILIALFRFFPASIELRQESFLWASDLSSYDSILSLPFTIPFYGDHVSLFTLFMALSMVGSTMLTSANQTASANMPGMKTMMYMMPIFMVVWFNSYASGLSYYYFLANLITILQTLIIRKFIINEEKVLATMEARKKKPVKKSRWAQRLEEAQKMAKQKQNKKR
jgi:YidC/Oxa1 family membrane protein insertase